MPIVRQLLKIENDDYSPVGDNLQNLLQRDQWLLEQELGKAHLSLFPLSNSKRDISAEALKALSDAGVIKFIKDNPIYLITVLNITPQALAMFINPECRALMGITIPSPNAFFNISVELSTLLKDEATRRDLQFCLPEVFQCNANAISLLKNPIFREILAYRAFALVKTFSFQNTTEKSLKIVNKFLEGVCPEKPLPENFSLGNSFVYTWTMFTNPPKTGGIGEQQDFVSWLMLPIIQTGLAFNYSPHLSNDEMAQYWIKANKIWSTLERQDKNQWKVLIIKITIKTLLALSHTQTPVLKTILNDESLINIVTATSTPEFFTPENVKQILQPYKVHLAAHPADFNRLLQRNRLIDSLQGYLDREDRQSSHKRQPVEALMADLKQGGEPAQRTVWHKNDNFYAHTFLKGELLACMTKYDLQVFLMPLLCRPMYR